MRQRILRLVVFMVHLFLCNIILAQTEDSTKLTVRKLSLQKKLGTGKTFLNVKPFAADHQILFKPNISYFKSFQQNYKPGEYYLFKSLTYKQSKTGEVFYGLGNYEHYNNSLICSANNNITLDIGFGLLKQNTIYNSDGPNLYLTFHSSLEYSFTNWLGVYFRGQYITSPLNRKKGYFDPFLYMNQMFLQTETETGLRAKYKNIKADIGVKTLHDKQFKKIKPVSTFNSKVTIGF